MDHPAAAKLPPSSSLLNLFPSPSPSPSPSSSKYSDPDVVELPSSSRHSNTHSHSHNRKRKRRSTDHSLLQPIDVDADVDVIQIHEDLYECDPHQQPEKQEEEEEEEVVIIAPTTLPPPIHKPLPHWPYLLHLHHPSTSSPPLPPFPAPLQTITPPPPPLSALHAFHFPHYDYFQDDDFDYDTFFSDTPATHTDPDPTSNLQAKFDGLDLPTPIEPSLPWLHKSFPTAPAPPPNSSNLPLIDDIHTHYKAFKQFDTVTDHTDHYFMRPKFNSSSLKPTKEWTKTVQNDWKLLEKDLPESIFVRVYEDRMDLLRAVIIGPAGTPYHDGLFFFDVHFPPTYPHVPPMVHYNSGGLRLNPNLYACGKVCLSLLNTWSGSGCERWNPANSTMLQVLISIQALVLNSKPYFNEPAYSVQANTTYGEQKSLAYNESTLLLSCKTMLYSLRRPPKHFEYFVAGHFRNRGYAILVACRAYIEGAQVGCLVGDGIQDVDEGDKSSSSSFKTSLKRIFEDLLMEFTVKGADCDEFLAQKRNQGTAAIPASQPSSATVTGLSLGGSLFHT